MPETTLRAFADDIAIVVPDVAKALPILSSVFEELGIITGLFLNKPKCVLIPLWPTDVDAAKTQIAQHFPYWADLDVKMYGTYLGYVIGPEAHDQSWKKPVQKYFDNARMWGKLGLGLHYTTMAYIIYIFPILSFVAQLQKPPEWVLKAEEEALRLIIPGPYRWILKEDLFHLSECYGQKISLPSLAQVCSAAQKRVYTFEHILKGGLRIQCKQEELIRCMRASEHLNRIHRWGSWLQNGPVTTLFNNSRALDEAGLDTSRIIDTAAGRLKEGETGLQRLMRTRPKFQRTVRKELVKRNWVDPL